MKKIYVPLGFYIVMAIFAFFFVFATVRIGDIISGLSMACLFGSVAAIIAYVVYIFKKVRVKILLFTFLVCLVGFLATTPFTLGGTMYM